MALWSPFQTLETNLGMSVEHTVLIFVLLAGLVFYAKDVRLGLIMHFFMFGGLVAWFYNAGLNFAPALILFFMALILMSFSLYATKTGPPAGIT